MEVRDNVTRFKFRGGEPYERAVNENCVSKATFPGLMSGNARAKCGFDNKKNALSRSTSLDNEMNLCDFKMKRNSSSRSASLET